MDCSPRSARNDAELALQFDEFTRQHRSGTIDPALDRFIVKTMQQIHDGYCWTGGSGRGQDGSTPTSEVQWAPNPALNYFKQRALGILDPAPGERILDIGSGFGTYVAWCAARGANCVGIDRDQRRVLLTNFFLLRQALPGRVLRMDASRLGFADGTFDKIMSGDFYEHITAAVKDAMLAEARRILKPGGRIVLKTPNLTYLRLSLVVKRFHATLHGRSPLRIHIPETPSTGVPDPEHIGLTTIGRCIRDLRRAGFKSVTPLYFEGYKLRPYLGGLTSVLTRRTPTRRVLAEEIIVTATV